MISLAEYAEQQHVSYEAVRQQVARYQNELDGHIVRQGRKRLLDDVAIEFLDSHRQESLGLGPNISVENAQLQKDLDSINHEYTAALKEISALKDTVIRLTTEIAEKNLLLAASKEEQQKYLQAVAETDDLKEKLEIQRAQNVDATAELNQVREQLQDEKQRSEVAQMECMEVNKQLEQERSRRISFREWWSRRK